MHILLRVLGIELLARLAARLPGVIRASRKRLPAANVSSDA